MPGKLQSNVIFCRICDGPGAIFIGRKRIRCRGCGGSGMARSTGAQGKRPSNLANLWQMRAEEMRSIAEETQSPDMRRILLTLAVDYDRMAERAASPRA